MPAKPVTAFFRSQPQSPTGCGVPDASIGTSLTSPNEGGSTDPDAVSHNAASNARHRWVSVKHAAEMLDVAESTVWRWIRHRPDFPQPVKLSPGCSRLSLPELLRHIAEQEAGQ
jgi:prophage regulatory protein